MRAKSSAALAEWLDPAAQDTSELLHLLRPYRDGAMRAYPVAHSVNAPIHDAPDCIEPIEGEE